LHRYFVPLASLALSLMAMAAKADDGGKNAQPLAIGVTFTIESKVLAETRRINVYMPPGYADVKEERYAVLYMPDGGIAEDFLHIAGLVQVSVGNNTMRPFLLVGIENTVRRRDLAGPTDDPKDKEIAPQAGGSEKFRAFLREELIPEVNRRFRTSEEKVIVGESLAGLFAVETFLLEPELFDAYIAIDPSLWWNRQQLAKSAVKRVKEHADSKKTLYLVSSAELEIAEMIKRLADDLNKEAKAKVQTHYEAMPQEAHSTIFHPAALKAFRSVLGPEQNK
jgi:uncharacterized protein